MSEGKSLLEVAAGAMAQSFPEIEEQEIKCYSSGPFQTIEVRQVSMTLVTSEPCVKPDVPPMLAPHPSG